MGTLLKALLLTFNSSKLIITHLNSSPPAEPIKELREGADFARTERGH